VSTVPSRTIRVTAHCAAMHQCSGWPCRLRQHRVTPASLADEKRLKTAQATEPGQQPSVRQTQPPRNKRKAISQPNLQPEKRSTRQRFSPRVFDPSDPTAVAGYVQHRGVSPDMQSSLPFDTG